MKKRLFCFIIILFLANGLNAEQLIIDVDKALIMAMEHDVSINSARLDVKSGDATVREAYSAAMPTIGLSGYFTHFMLASPVYFEAFDAWVRLAPINSASLDLTLQQPLWLAGKIGLGLDAARTYRRIARDALDGGRAQLKSDVIRDYFGLVLAHQVVEVTVESLEQAERHSQTVKRMFDVGMASEFDYLRAQVEVESLKPELLRAQQNAQLAEIVLKNRIGIRQEVNLTVNEDIESVDLEDFILDDDAAFSSAMQHRAEFRVLSLQKRLQKINLTAEQRSIYWPNLFFALGYQRQSSVDRFGDISDGVNWVENSTWTLSAQIPLFDGFATHARSEKARIGVRRVELDQLRLEQGVRLEVMNAVSELKRSLEQVSSRQAVMDLAEKALGIANTRFEQGLGTELDVLDSQLTRKQARLGLLQGYYELRIARAEYARIVEADSDLPGDN